MVWDTKPKDKYTDNIRATTDSLNLALKYAKNYIKRDEEDFVETLSHGWEEVDLEVTTL